MAFGFGFSGGNNSARPQQPLQPNGSLKRNLMSSGGSNTGGNNPQNPPGGVNTQNNNQGTEQNPPNTNNKDNNQDNNSGTKDDTIATIWEDMNTPPPPNNNQNGNGNNNNQNNPPQSDPQKDVDNYLDGLGLGNLTISEQELESFKSGEGVQTVLNNLNQRIRTAHLKAVSAANTLMENKIATAVEKAVKESKSFYKGEQLRGILHDQLPFTKDSAIGPVAESAMRKFLEKGASVEQAVEGTKRFFSHINQKSDPNYVTPNSNMRGSFNRNNAPAQPTGPAGDDENGWLSVLRAQ